MAHLFDTYHRGTNTTERLVKGSGLGIGIAKQRLRRMVLITVGSEPGAAPLSLSNCRVCVKVTPPR